MNARLGPLFLGGLKVQEEIDDELCKCKRQNQEKRDNGYGRLAVIPGFKNRLIPIEGSFDIRADYADYQDCRQHNMKPFAGHRENATLAVFKVSHPVKLYRKG